MIYKEVVEALKHYDLLIDEGNDPVLDSEELKAYMDKWDGTDFIEAMSLDKLKSVLEIGVGTGRVAIKTAPLCKDFCGIDISPKTVARAKENLKGFNNTNIICGDFLNWDFDVSFDVIYSTLTFMHIENKSFAVKKVSDLLKPQGRFVLSIDKSKSEYIDFGTRRVRIFSDTEDAIKDYIEKANLKLLKNFDTEFAVVFVAEKEFG